MDPIQHEGLNSGETIPLSSWTALVDADGQAYNISAISKLNDVVVLFADPRRMTSSFRAILDQFKKLPVIALKVSIATVNLDDPNDVRKFLKKNSLPFPFLCNPSKTVRYFILFMSSLFYFFSNLSCK